MLTESAEGPLVAKVILLTVFIGDEFLVFLIDGVIGQMHEFVLLVNLLGVGFGSESGQALLMNVDP